MSEKPGDTAQVVIRRERGGSLRAYVDGRPLAGLKSTTIECVGFGQGTFLLRLSGAHVRLEDEEGGQS